MKFFINYQTALKFLLFAFLLQLVPIINYAVSQNDSSYFEIRGIVKSSDTHEGITGVNIIVKGSNHGTVSNYKGEFNIEVKLGDTLIFSSVGFYAVEETIYNKNNLNVLMNPSTTYLDEAVIIGYGVRERKDITGSISDIKARDIEKSNAFSIEQSLQGQMPGVYVSGFSGNLNDRPRIFIRGMNTWGITDPLIVIDGIPVKEFGTGAEKTNEDNGYYYGGAIYRSGYVNIFNLINTLDIESYSVLKDASSSAIYGVNASNGVILINTRKGTAGQPRFRLNASFGYTMQPKQPDLLNTQEFIELVREANKNVGNQNIPPEFTPDSIQYQGDSETYNWLEAFYRDKALRSDINLTISGGNNDNDYYIGIGYSKREGAAIQNFLNRYTISSNLNAKINRWLSGGLNIKMGYMEGTDSKGVPGLYKSAEAIAYSIHTPWQPIYNSDGPIEWHGYDAPYDTTYSINGTDTQGNPIWQLNRSNRYGNWTTYDNAIALVDPNLSEKSFNSIRTLGNAYMEIHPFAGFYMKGRLMFDWTDSKETNWSSIHSIMFSEGSKTLDRFLLGMSEGEITLSKYVNYNLVGDITIGYKKHFGEHDLDILFNAMDQSYGFEGSTSSTSQLTTSHRPGIYNFGYSEYLYATANKYESALQGYLGRFTYSYDNKYFLDVSVRRDGSSRFAPENRWGTFPAASFAWRLSQEIFMTHLHWVNDLKLRAGWGQIGNQEVQAFAFLPTIYFTPKYRYGSGDGDPIGNYDFGARIPRFANRDLQWETTETINLALEGFLFNRFNFTFEYFHKVTKDLLQIVSLPGYVGNELDPFINVGSVLNRGIEVELGYQGSVRKLNYMIGGNFSTIHNEVLETYDHREFFTVYENSVNFGIREGYPVFYRRAYKAGGIFQSQEEVDMYQLQKEDKIAMQQNPGDLWFYDIGGNPTNKDSLGADTPDGIIDKWDQTMISRPLPGFYYGLKTQVEWNGFDLYCLFSGVGDYYKLNGWRKAGMQMISNNQNQFVEVKNRWTADNRSTKIHRAALGDPAQNSRSSDWYLENAAYFRLTSWQIGYDFNRLIKPYSQSVKKLRLYIGGNNAFTFTSWSGMDPDSDMESTWGGFEKRTPTNGRSFIVGLNVEF